jgi:Protein of unknown function (DUF3047)
MESSDGQPSRVHSRAGSLTGVRWHLIAALAGILLLGACATPPPYVDPQAPIGASPWALGSGDSGDLTASDADTNATTTTVTATPATSAATSTATTADPLAQQKHPRLEWLHLKLAGKQVNAYMAVLKDGRHAVRAQSDASVSLLRQKVRIPPHKLQSINFSWNVTALLAKADMAQRNNDDSPARIVLAFEGDRSRFSAKNAMLSDLSQTLTGEPLPYATLMYVWCNTRAPGTVIVNPRTDRIRKIVVESGAKNLNQWRDYERNIRADYIKAFGEAPGALVGIGIMTDTDNTRGMTTAWYGKVKLGATSKSAPTILSETNATPGAAPTIE